VVQLTSGPVANCVIRWVRSAGVDSFSQIAIESWWGERRLPQWCWPIHLLQIVLCACPVLLHQRYCEK